MTPAPGTGGPAVPEDGGDREALVRTVREAIVMDSRHGPMTPDESLSIAEHAVDAALSAAADDDCADYLRGQAEKYAKEADAANRRPATRPHAAVLARQANACAFAAGVLRTRSANHAKEI